MPEFKKLTDKEVEAIKEEKQPKGPSKRGLVRQEYKEYMSQFKPGDWVEVTPGEGEKRQTVKNRLVRAAGDLGYQLHPIEYQNDYLGLYQNYPDNPRWVRDILDFTRTWARNIGSQYSPEDLKERDR